MILLIIMFYVIVGFLEISALLKKDQKKELILYSSIFSLAFILSILMNLGVKIPSPAKPIENIVNIIKGFFY